VSETNTQTDMAELARELTRIVGSRCLMVNADGSMSRVDAHAIAGQLNRRGAWDAASDGAIIYARRAQRGYQSGENPRYRIQLQRGESTIELVKDSC
jgi:hypothetical protein